MAQSNASTKNTTWSVFPTTPRAPRTPATAVPGASQGFVNTVGYGRRSLWAYPPIGESAQRDPHVPDPTPGLDRQPQSQANASPAVRSMRYAGRNFHSGGGSQFNGTAPQVIYLKELGTLVTRSLSRNYLSGVVETRWRVGGIGYPNDYGFGPGYHGDSETVYPNNPQVYLRNPGIQPLTNVPPTYRYAPNMTNPSYVGYVVDNGPSIGDVGNTYTPGQSGSTNRTR